VCLACITAIASPQHINCRKTISLVSLRGVINVLRTLVCTTLNHRTSNNSRTPNKILSLSECYEGRLKTGSLSECYEGRLKTGPHFRMFFSNSACKAINI
jgi:hypothetical protein